MADTVVKEKIYRMKFEGSETMIQNLVKIQEEADKVRASMKKQAEETGKNTAEYAKLNIELKNLAEQERAQVKEIQNTEKAMKAQGNTLEGLRAKLSLMTAEQSKMKLGTEEYKKQEKAVNELSKKIGLLDQASNRFNGNVGNYKNSVMEAFYVMGINMVAVEKAIVNAKVAMVAMEMATNKGAFAMKILKVAIISTGIGALVAIVGTLNAYFSSSSDRADKFKKIVAPFEQTFKAIERAVFGFIDSISVAFDWVAKLFGLVNDEQQKQIDKDAQLRKYRKATQLEEAELNVKRSKLLLEMGKKESLSREERMEIAKKALALDDQIFERKMEIAKREWESIVENNKLKNKVDKEAKMAEKEAQLNYINLESEKYDRQRRTTSRLETLLQQQGMAEDRLDKTKEAISEKDKKRSEERLKVLEEEKKRIEELQQTAFEFSQQIFDLIAKNEAKVNKAKQDAENAMQKAFGNKPEYGEEMPVEESPEMKRIFAEHEYRRRLEAETAKERMEAVRKAVEDGVMAESEGKAEIMKIRAEQLEDYAAGLSAMKGLFKENTAMYKTIATAETLMATYIGVTKWLAKVELWPFNIAMAVTTGLQGAMNVAKINNVKFAKGGIVGGRSHEQGGTVYRGEDGQQFEVERGELITVVNRFDTERLKALSAANSIHGRPFFAAGGMYQPRTDLGNQSQMTSIINQVVESVAAIPVVVSERDISTAQRRVYVAEKTGDL